VLRILNKFFKNPRKETIKIFEEKSKIQYDPTLFSSLKVLSLEKSQLEYLNPLSVFINLEILNISGNGIKNIDALKNLKKLKILDLRFNKIETPPDWLFELAIKVYWKREDEEKEGIYLEGNPLNKKLIDKIKEFSKEEYVCIEAEKLLPLNRQSLIFFTPNLFSSRIIKELIKIPKSDFKVNFSIVNYDKNHKLETQKELSEILHYAVILLTNTTCCIHPPILELISTRYPKSKIFLILENSTRENVQEKIDFFKNYNNSINLIDIYYAFDGESTQEIVAKIYDYLKETTEAKSLWRDSWIALRDEVEENPNSTITDSKFEELSDKYHLSLEVREVIFKYLIRVGSIQ